MGLFNSTCCPPKPKRTMDYILNWIDTNGLIISKNTSFINDLIEWRRSIENDLYGHVKDVADEYITNYDWSTVPQFDTLSRSIATKANKVANAVPGHIVSLDTNGNLEDSGAGIDAVIEEGNPDLVPSGTIYTALQGKANKVAGATNGHLVSLDANGNLQDSGKEPADFAKANLIKSGEYGDAQAQVGTQVLTGDGGKAYVAVSKWIDGALQLKQAFVSYDNIDNLNLALEGPNTTPTSGSDKLITSGGVYTALTGKADKDFSNRVYARLMEFEKLSSIKYSITATYTGTESGKIKLMLDDKDIVRDYNPGDQKITALWNVPYLFNLVLVGDTLEAKKGGQVIGTATVTAIASGPPTIILSGLLCSLNTGDVGAEITISIIHNE